MRRKRLMAAATTMVALRGVVRQAVAHLMVAGLLFN